MSHGLINVFKVSVMALLPAFYFSCSNSDNTDAKQPTVSLNAKTISEDSLELKKMEGLVYYHNEPFTGTSSKLYPNGVRAKSIEYKAGRRHGKYIKRFENGHISFKSNYVDGRQQGKTISWWRNGNRRSESNYKSGVPEGEQREWYKSGAKFKKMTIVNGQEEGMQQSWRENGKLYNNYEAKNGRIFGLKRAALCFQLEDEEVQYKVD